MIIADMEDNTVKRQKSVNFPESRERLSNRDRGASGPQTFFRNFFNNWLH